MASTATFSPRAFDTSPAAQAHSKKSASFFSRVIRALVESRQRQADRLIAGVIARHGGRWTDALERQIERDAF